MPNILACMNAPTKVDCLPAHGLQLEKLNVAGGFHFNNTRFDTFRVSFVNSPIGNNFTGQALRNVFEHQVEDYLAAKKSELAKLNVFLVYKMLHDFKYTTDTDLRTPHHWYVALFCGCAHTVYLSWVMMLGRRPRITLAFGIICINVVSITSAVGLLSYVGFKPPNDLFNIVPYVVMAIGADNMVVLVVCCQQSANNVVPSGAKSFGTHIGRTLCQIGSSLRVNAICPIVGCIIVSHAVNHYESAMAVYLAAALTINWLLQETCFIAMLSLDLRRQANDRCDPLCAIRLRQLNDEDDRPKDSFVDTFIQRRVIPMLTRRLFQVCIIIMSSATVYISLNHHFFIAVGENMDQYLPNDSNVKEYTRFDLKRRMAGPPVYFVLKGNIDYSINMNRVIIDNDYEWSIPNEIERAGWLSPKRSYMIPIKVNSWWNDYQQWRMTPDCCRRSIKTNEYCQPDGIKYL